MGPQGIPQFLDTSDAEKYEPAEPVELKPYYIEGGDKAAVAKVAGKVLSYSKNLPEFTGEGWEFTSLNDQDEEVSIPIWNYTYQWKA